MGKDKTSQLRILHGHLVDIDNDIAVIATPIEQLNTLLGDVIDLLGKPKTFSDDLKTIGEILGKIQSIASDADWLPEVGQVASSLSKALLPVVKEPPPAGGIGEIRTSLNEIDVILTPLQNKLKKAQGAIQKVIKVIHGVEFDVHSLVNGTHALMQRYADHPPENVEKCAKGLNEGIETVADELRSAREQVAKQLNEYLSPLKNVENAFHRVDGYLKMIQTVYEDLSLYTKALREVESAVNTAASYGKKKVEYLFTWVGRHTYPDLYEKIKKKLDSANTCVNQMVGKIANFALAPMRQAVSTLEDEVAREVNRIPEIAALEDEMASAQRTLEKLEHEMVAAVSGECAKILGENHFSCG